MEFQYLLWICSNISESSLKTQLFEIFNIHMDKYLLPFEISFLQLLVKKYLVGEKKEEEERGKLNQNEMKLIGNFILF